MLSLQPPQGSIISNNAESFIKPAESFMLAVALTVLTYFLQGRLGISLSDEGYLWYGALRAAEGQVPMLDFRAYDPGRYYWVAAWSRVFGDGIMGLRASVAVFQALGLAAGLFVLRRFIERRWLWGLCGVVLVLWMLPRHKLFEHSVAMIYVCTAMLLIERPTRLRHFAAGLVLGLGAVIGRNHGLYGLAGLLMAMAYAWGFVERGDLAPRALAFGAGISVGYAPEWLMMVLVPGFFDALTDSVIVMMKRGSTNLPLPVPWPWRLGPEAYSWQNAGRLFTGLHFVLMPAFYAVLLVRLFLLKEDEARRAAPLVAAVFIGLVYLHFAFSRADVSHLAQSIHPFILAVFAAWFLLKRGPVKAASAVLAVVLLAATWFTAIGNSPYRLLRMETKEVRIWGDNLRLSTHNARIIEGVQALGQRIANNEGVFFAPLFCTFYPVLDKPSPVWEIFFTIKASKEKELGMIEDMKASNVSWAIIGMGELDGRPELRFDNTHPLLWRYIVENFERQHTGELLPGSLQIFRRR